MTDVARTTDTGGQDHSMAPVLEVDGLSVEFATRTGPVRVVEDVTFRVPPFDKNEADRMVREVKGFKLLEGTRGQKPANVRGLVDVIMKVQKLAVDHADALAELDINPLLVGPKRVVALDALAVPK